MTTTTIKYDFEPAQPSPGDDFEKFEERLMNAAAKSDKRGWSYADHMLGVDEGGPAGPAFPAANAALGMGQEALPISSNPTWCLAGP